MGDKGLELFTYGNCSAKTPKSSLIPFLRKVIPMHQWWECYYIEEFVQQIQVLGDVVAKRFLPAFDNLEEEATKIEQAAYNDLNASAGPDSDPAALAERASQAGLVHYQNLTHL